MNFKGVEICCPHCRGDLEQREADKFACATCSRSYPVLLGIPDLRIFSDPYISVEEDRAKGRRLAERFDEFDLEGFVRYYYSISPLVPSHCAREYARGLVASAERAEAWLQSWEAATGVTPAGSLLDLGCGTAPLLVAARNYPQRAGVDIAFRWLVVGKKRLAQAGLDLPLICACAEALPFPELSFDRVAVDSVIEHLRDQPRGLREARRVLRPAGSLFLATPNRFSVGPDPQTKIWAGAWLPQRCTAAIVRWQGGLPPVRRLHSASGVRRLLAAAGFRDIRVFLPAIPPRQRSMFSPMVKRLMTVYDYARCLPVSRSLLFLLGPMLHAVASRPLGSAGNE